jgi:hypothetical protein
LDNLLRYFFRDCEGQNARGILTTARVPNPIINSKIISVNVIKPIKFDLITFINMSFLKAG